MLSPSTCETTLKARGALRENVSLPHPSPNLAKDPKILVSDVFVFVDTADEMLDLRHLRNIQDTPTQEGTVGVHRSDGVHGVVTVRVVSGVGVLLILLPQPDGYIGRHQRRAE